MKKLLIAFSMISAGALVASADAQSNSVTTNYASQAWFSASASGTEITTPGGEFKKKTSSESSCAAKNSKIEFDSELDDPITFELNSGNNKTCDLVRVSFDLEASVVPYSTQSETLPADAKLAFALCENSDKTATNFCAKVGSSSWTTLSALNSVVPDVSGEYTLVMRFDDSVTSAKKVQFAVTSGSATQTTDWFPYGGLAADAGTKIDFAGCGKMTSMNAVQVSIVSAKVVFEGGSVTIAAEDEKAMEKLVGTGIYDTIEKVLAAHAREVVTGGSITIAESCNLSTAEAYAIGLIANENGNMVAKADGTFKVRADATAAVTENIPVKFAVPLASNDSTATISYQLQGSATGSSKDEDWTNVGSPTSNQDDIQIPTANVGSGANKYNYFRVKTTVTLEGVSK